MKYLFVILILGLTQSIFSQKSNILSEEDKQYLVDNYRTKTFAELAGDIGVQTYFVREFCNSGLYPNVFWDGAETLNCLYSNEPIEPNSKGEYYFFYSSNEDRRVYEKTLLRPQRFLFYKFKTKEYAQNWCDGIPFETKEIPFGPNTTPSIDHFTIDGYELTKYINISDITVLKNKLTEFNSLFHKIEYDRGARQFKFQEHNIPGYVLVTTERSSINGVIKTPHYYFNQRAIKIIYDYLSKYGYSYFTGKVLGDLPMNDMRIRKECKKTYSRNETIECPNCNGESRFIDHSDKYSTESRSVMQNCTSCDRTFRFQVWNWNSRGWKVFQEKKLGYEKCSGCKGYGFSEDYHGGGKDDVTREDCHVYGCNNGWQECRKCYGKGQKRSTVYVKKKDETTQNNECTRCNNSGKINTGKTKTFTCSSCDGKGFYFYSDENKDWDEIKEYYKYNQVIRPDLGFNGGVRYSDLKWKGLKGGTYFIYQTDLGLEYNRFGTGSLLDKNETVSKYDFVQIAFQRKIKK